MTVKELKELIIESFSPSFGEFILNLSQSNATINLGNVSSKFKYNVNRIKLNNNRVGLLKKAAASKNLISVKGDYSTLVIN